MIPEMSDDNEKVRTIDELPQSADGKTIMTTEPKFIPKEAAVIHFSNQETGKIRLVTVWDIWFLEAVGAIEEEKSAW